MPAKHRPARGSSKKVTPSFFGSVTGLNALGTLWRSAFVLALLIVFISYSLFQYVFSAAEFSKSFGVAYQPWQLVPNGEYLADGLVFLFIALAAFILYDGLYVGIARRYAMNEVVDRWLLVGVEAMWLGAALLSFTLTLPVVVGASYQAYEPLRNVLGTVGLIVTVAAVVLPAARAIVGVSWVMSRVRVRKRA